MTDWLGRLDILPEVASPVTPAKRKCCFWTFRLNPELSGFTQMGLMTDDSVEAQKQLTAIYGRPVISLKRLV